MDERKQKILSAIVQDYIATAEPVGSRTIARKYQMGVSPATIRNEMADLEEQGYLEQPHTSAGRIPSQKGYRYYVDHLMQPAALSNEEKHMIRASYQAKVDGITQVIKLTGNILSQLTAYTSLVVSAPEGAGEIRYVQLVRLAPGKAMLLVVLEPGKVRHRTLAIPENIGDEDLKTISEVFNAKIKGCHTTDIKKTLMRELYAELIKHKSLVNMVLDLLQESEKKKEERIYLGGLVNMLSQPEFSNVERVKTLMSLLEQENFCYELLGGDCGGKLSVRIGEEIKREDVRDCSIVSSRYVVDGQPSGSLAVLGPTRMDYAKVVAVIEYLTENLSTVLNKLYRSK
ncbi:heat-inducible transcriptional repressor HrcA [Desulforudis sp. 1088]|uniref:heat-inducible transcriptional repressor HrcA n=1 Tax=unclassified Candidatus Desulforudis TaxID=2635950 RepID=UPI003CE55F7D